MILGFKSVMLYLSGVKSKADLAVASGLSFLFVPVWVGIQQKRISLFDMESGLQSDWMMSEFSSFFFLFFV